MKRLLLAGVLGSLLVFFPGRIQAQGKPFETSFDLDFVVDEQGRATIVQNIALKNLTSNTYASEYALEIGSTQLNHIRALNDDGQPIPFDTITTDNSTVITLRFAKEVVGKDRVRQFSISYQNLDAASLRGQVLELTIPGLSSTSEGKRTSLTVTVPKKFGNPSQITPDTYTLLETDAAYILEYENLGNTQGVTALFGTTQIMNYTLNYHLENPTVNKAITQIALPPDTALQKVYYDSIQPLPDKINTDLDGNWLATYVLDPKEKFTVVAQGQVELFLRPTVDIPQYNNSLSDYLQPKEYWPVQDEQMQTLADELGSARAIYDYIVENFSYDYTKLDASVVRLGGKTAINQPDSAVCQEFTDAFITLARAAGIPAREVNGFAYTQNAQLRPLSLIQDVLHSWPEYFDETRGQWIPVDPTWGNTTGLMDYFSTFDLNHFSFVVHGLDSSRPYPAGYYKQSDTTGKDVIIDFGQAKPQPKIDLEAKVTPSVRTLLGLPGPLTLEIESLSNIALYNVGVQIAASEYELIGSNDLTAVLPHSKHTYTIRAKAKSPLDINGGIIVLQIDEKEINVPFNYQSQIPKIIFLLVVLGGAGFGGAFITWRVLVSRRK